MQETPTAEQATQAIHFVQTGKRSLEANAQSATGGTSTVTQGAQPAADPEPAWWTLGRKIGAFIVGCAIIAAPCSPTWRCTTDTLTLISTGITWPLAAGDGPGGRAGVAGEPAGRLGRGEHVVDGRARPGSSRPGAAGGASQEAIRACQAAPVAA